MVGERPLGAFLSGGLDSSAVVAAMARQTSERIKTFSVGFDDGRIDERRYARMLAKHYATDHTEMVVTASALDILPTLIWHYDEPFADSSAIPSFYVAQMSSRQVTVVLNGDGGDELFGGYRRYLLMSRIGRIPVLSLFGNHLDRVGSSLSSRGAPRSVLHTAGLVVELLGHPTPRRYAQLMAYFTSRQKAMLYSDALREQVAGVDSYELIDDMFAASRADSDVGRVMDVDVNTYLPNDLLVKMDIATMANSLEARPPFLDQYLMEWAAGLPVRLKVRAGTTKYLLKKAVRGWLPSGLVTRPKMGFGVPLATWLRTELRESSWDVLTDHTARSRGLFRPAAVRELLLQHGNGRDHANRIWALVQFELWCRRFVDTPPPRPDPPAASRARRPAP